MQEVPFSQLFIKKKHNLWPFSLVKDKKHLILFQTRKLKFESSGIYRLNNKLIFDFPSIYILWMYYIESNSWLRKSDAEKFIRFVFFQVEPSLQYEGVGIFESCAIETLITVKT